MNHKPILMNGVKKGLYEIYEDGRIWSNYKNDFLIPNEDKDGYLEIILSGGSRDKHRYLKIHTIVAIHFIGNPPSEMIDPTVNHIDNNIKNNLYTNLEWIERGVNSSIRNNKGTGELNHEAILTDKDVVKICELIVSKQYTLKAIGDMFGVSRYTISNIKRKVNWKHISKNYVFN